MHNKTTKRRKKLLVGLTVAFMMLLLALFFFNVTMDNLLENAIKDNLTTKAEQEQQEINKDFSSATNRILGIANSISFYGYDEDNLFEYLKSHLDISMFDDLHFVDLQGNSVSATDTYKDFTNAQYVEEAKNNVYTTSDMYVSEKTGQDTINIAASVSVDGEEVGVLIGEYSLKSVEDVLVESMVDEWYVLICDNTGAEVFSTTEDYIPFEELAEAEILDGESIKQITSDLMDKGAGVVHFALDGVEVIGVYAPIDINDWSIVLIADKDDVLLEARVMINSISVISVGVFIMLVIILIFTGRSKMKSIKEMEKIAYYDELTGAPNVLKFRKDIKDILAKKPNDEFATVKIDVENFKAINELFSFDVGNKVICAFETTAASVDEDDFVYCRSGIDAFMFFGRKEFLGRLEELTAHYENYFKEAVPEIKNHRISFRYGRYFLEPGENDVNEIINKTNMAHSIAKVKHASGIWDYDEEYKKQLVKQAEITDKMNKALENREFVPYMQPKISLQNSNCVVGAEALVRWIQSDGSMVYPNEFIPLFEANGFIVEIDRYILKCVCETVRDWIDKGYECPPISVNFSRRHLDNPCFVKEVMDIVDSYKIDHKYIEIELTETVVLDKENVLENALNSFSDEGFSVAIDDFGSGYSSLGLLKNFKVDTLKLDRSFLVNNREEERAECVIDGIIKLAHSLSMNIVAEGVEEEDQVNFLRKVNCESAQGYFYAKPMTTEDFETIYFLVDVDE